VVGQGDNSQAKPFTHSAALTADEVSVSIRCGASDKHGQEDDRKRHKHKCDGHGGSVCCRCTPGITPSESASRQHVPTVAAMF
jgi:hypothetical protein